MEVHQIFMLSKAESCMEWNMKSSQALNPTLKSPEKKNVLWLRKGVKTRARDLDRYFNYSSHDPPLNGSSSVVKAWHRSMLRFTRRKKNSESGSPDGVARESRVEIQLQSTDSGMFRDLFHSISNR